MNLIETKSEEKSATTLELFFDLVFVFAITQVVGFIVHDPTWSGLLRAGTLLGILWWGWHSICPISRRGLHRGRQRADR